MADVTVSLVIPFEKLKEIAAGLSLEDKQRLWEFLYEQIEQDEEAQWSQNPAHQAEIDEALRDYQEGRYVTIQQYIDRQAKE